MVPLEEEKANTDKPTISKKLSVCGFRHPSSIAKVSKKNDRENFQVWLVIHIKQLHTNTNRNSESNKMTKRKKPSGASVEKTKLKAWSILKHTELCAVTVLM